MKKCQGTFSYIFSPQPIKTFAQNGLIADSQYHYSHHKIFNYWFTANQEPFCFQLRQITNEEGFNSNEDNTSLTLLQPGFLEKIELPQPVQINPGTIRGLLVNDTPEAHAYLKNWILPFEITWAKNSENTFFHELSYRKTFPYWSVLLHFDDQKVFQNFPSQTFPAPRSRWVHLETASWDLISF